MAKCVEWAIVCARNEAEDIRGWAKTCLYFAQKVLCVVDPATSDNTAAALQKEFPTVRVAWQDRSLGDSDNDTKGEKKQLICHANFERAINENMRPGEWVLMLAPDERFRPDQWEAIAKMVKMVRESDLAGGITFPSIHNFITETACIDYYHTFRFGALTQLKFMQYTGAWRKGHTPHSGYDLPPRLFVSPFPMYHYCWLKTTRVPYGTWRDNQTYREYPRYFLPNPIQNWRDLSDHAVK